MPKSVVLMGWVLALLVMAVPVLANDWMEVTAGDVREMMLNEDPLVIFPLSRIEFNDLHIVDSLNIPLSRLEKMLPADHDRKLIFYCLGPKCTASPKAADLAVKLGYRNVYAFIGGLPAWVKAGYPTRTIDPLPKVTPPTITPAELFGRLQEKPDTVLLDVRQRHDVSKGYIDTPGRVFVPLDDLFSRRREVPRGGLLVICCQKGKRAPTAARYLLGKHFENVVVLEDGVQGWKSAGYAVAHN